MRIQCQSEAFAYRLEAAAPDWERKLIHRNTATDVNDDVHDLNWGDSGGYGHGERSSGLTPTCSCGWSSGAGSEAAGRRGFTQHIKGIERTAGTRLAMPWYHVSPHDLPEGTQLTPGGGKSPYADDPIYSSDPARAKHVWVTDSPQHAWDWAQTAEEQTGERPGHTYEVEPHAAPQVYDHEYPDDEWTTPGATVKHKVVPTGGDRMATALDDYRTERHRQEQQLNESQDTYGYASDKQDYLDRGGKPLITYKDWMKGRAKSPAQLADEQGPLASHEVYTPDPSAWGMPGEAPSW